MGRKTWKEEQEEQGTVAQITPITLDDGSLEAERMNECLTKSIDWLCKSPYCNRERIMESQYMIIRTILESYLSGKKAFILEAPTGVGKSIIGIIVAESIRRYMEYPKGSPCTYVLTSSKMLQDQMDRDKDNFNLHWTVLKGQANYICNQNQKSFLERECKDYSVSKADKEMQCAHACGYIIARKKAMVYDAAILSYAYWLTSMNFVYEMLGEYAPFQKRHVTIFDECHMLSDIVVNMFQTVINDSITKRLGIMHDLLLQQNVTAEQVNYSLEAKADIQVVINSMMDTKISVDDMFTQLITFYEKLHMYNKFYQAICNRYLPEDPKLWEGFQRKMDNMCESLHKYTMQINYFINENKDYIGFIVKTYTTDQLGNTTMTLRSLREQAIIKEHVHKYTDFALFMSATIGDADVFASNNGIENYDTLYIESMFDYSNSPIYRVSPPISLALKQKAQNMQELLYRMLYVCEELHPSERGLIHTGNFEISKNFREFIWDHSNNPHRFIFYTDAHSKQKAIEKLAKSKNGVIIGPSLTEGLDLKDDLCRFCILAKVPYPMLDEYNSKKMKMMPEWYSWKTMTNVMQALGRGIRHKKDWCVTYFMDSCFEFLFSKTRVPKYIKSRMQEKVIGNLQQKALNMMDQASGLFAYSGEGGVVAAPKPKETLDTIDVDAMLKETTSPKKEEEYEDDLPF